MGLLGNFTSFDWGVGPNWPKWVCIAAGRRQAAVCDAQRRVCTKSFTWGNGRL